MDCKHTFQVNSSNVGTCPKCGEVRQFPWDKGEVTVLKKGDPSISQVSKKEEAMTSIRQRHKYYEANKQAIIADLASTGRAATLKKWKMPPSSLHSLEKRWLTREKMLKLPINPGRPPGRPGETPHPSTSSTQSASHLPTKAKQIVLVEWLDSKGLERWEYLDEIHPITPSVCYSVGFLIDDNQDYKTIALGLSDTQVLGRTTIPSGCIKSTKTLTIP